MPEKSRTLARKMMMKVAVQLAVSLVELIIFRSKKYVNAMWY